VGIGSSFAAAQCGQVMIDSRSIVLNSLEWKTTVFVVTAIRFRIDRHDKTMHPVATTGSNGFLMMAITVSRNEELPIGELSRRSGVNIETIRYYERVKLLSPPRTASGRRIFGATELRILVFIRRARELGFSLDEIRALLRLSDPEKASCREVRDIASHHLQDIRSKLHDLKKLERLLATTVSRCSGRVAPDCPVLDILDIERSG
jgi:MerR family mercuric resistance operon transcriptional regulator